MFTAQFAIYHHVPLPSISTHDYPSSLVLFADDNDNVEDGNLKWESAMSANTFSSGKNIARPRSYREAVNDPVWGDLWKEAVDTKINALISNKIWKEVVPPPKTNIVTCK